MRALALTSFGGGRLPFGLVDLLTRDPDDGVDDLDDLAPPFVGAPLDDPLMGAMSGFLREIKR